MASRIKILLLGVVVIGGYIFGKSQAEYRPLELAAEDNILLQSFANQDYVARSQASTECPKQQGKCHESYKDNPPLLLVSMDGFRADYLERGLTPTLNKIARCGTRAPFMYSVFPTKTFPNHFSIVTGVNPESHGVIDNNMYDPSTGKTFKTKSPDFNLPFWFQRDPIWVTAVKQGKRSATYHWIGSDLPIGGVYPTYYKKYERQSFESKVDQVLDWLELPSDTRPHFVNLYFNQPDNAGHASGTHTSLMNDTLKSMDVIIERLFNGLESRNLLDCVNVMIVSDHGMSNAHCSRAVDLNKYIDTSSTFGFMGVFGRLRPNDSTTDVNSLVKKLRCQTDRMRVYPKEQLPVRMHYNTHDRIEPIFLELDNEWTVVSTAVQTGDRICSNGAHGYDNLYKDMRALFMAHGPSIKSSYTTDPFISTELYELMSELINIKPNPNNGTRGSLHHILKSPKKLPIQLEQDPPSTGSVPTDQNEYKFRVDAADCSCSQRNKQVDVTDRRAVKNKHLPFGVPYSAQDNSTLRMLYNEENVIGFDLKYRIPSWISFTLDKKQKMEANMIPECYMGDARIPMSDTAKCSDYANAFVKKNFIQQRPLYSFGFSDLNTKATYITNSIPKSLNHTNTLEKEMNEILSRFVSESNQVNVVMGSAFDLWGDGHKPSSEKIMELQKKYEPLIVPTHIFVIATWCSESVDNLKKCSPANLKTNGFLLPNEPYVENCETPEAMIRKNVARVVDIENLTGFSFFTGLPIYDAIRLRTAMPSRFAPS